MSESGDGPDEKAARRSRRAQIPIGGVTYLIWRFKKSWTKWPEDAHEDWAAVLLPTQ